MDTDYKKALGRKLNRMPVAMRSLERTPSHTFNIFMFGFEEAVEQVKDWMCRERETRCPNCGVLHHWDEELCRSCHLAKRADDEGTWIDKEGHPVNFLDDRSAR